MRTPKAPSNSIISATGIGAPPDTHNRSDAAAFSVSILCSRAWCNRAQYMVGTPTQQLTCSRSNAWSTAPASKRGRSTRRYPPAMPAFICVVWPVE